MFNNLDMIAQSIGWQVVAYRGWYELDNKNGVGNFYCENLNQVAVALSKVVQQKPDDEIKVVLGLGTGR